jgi:hypothetical protein
MMGFSRDYLGSFHPPIAVIAVLLGERGGSEEERKKCWEG